MCDICGAGPWINRRALRGHKIKKHGYRNAVQATTCPICHREFTPKSAAQRHVKKQSCGKAVRNHGHAGAVAGSRIAEAAARAAARAAVTTKAQAAAQSTRSTQTQLRKYFGTHSHAGFGLSSRALPHRGPRSAGPDSRFKSSANKCRRCVKYWPFTITTFESWKLGQL